MSADLKAGLFVLRQPDQPQAQGESWKSERTIQKIRGLDLGSAVTVATTFTLKSVETVDGKTIATIGVAYWLFSGDEFDQPIGLAISVIGGLIVGWGLGS